MTKATSALIHLLINKGFQNVYLSVTFWDCSRSGSADPWFHRIHTTKKWPGSYSFLLWLSSFKMPKTLFYKYFLLLLSVSSFMSFLHWKTYLCKCSYRAKGKSKKYGKIMICFLIVKAKIVGFGSESMQKSRIRIREDQKRNVSHGSGFEILLPIPDKVLKQGEHVWVVSQYVQRCS